MSSTELKTIRKLSDDEMIYEIKTIKQELFNLRLKKATSQLSKLHQIKKLKKKLRQLLTIQHQTKQLVKNSLE